MPLMIVETELTPQDHYDVLDAHLTDTLEAAGVDYDDEEVMRRLISFDRQLRIALGIPVEMAN